MSCLDDHFSILNDGQMGLSNNQGPGFVCFARNLAEAFG